MIVVVSIDTSQHFSITASIVGSLFFFIPVHLPFQKFVIIERPSQDGGGRGGVCVSGYVFG